jgi:hypothetical protein
MSEIDKFISKVESEKTTAQVTGILPEPEKERAALKRLIKKFPELNIDLEEEVKILKHTRLSLNARNN